MRNSKGHIPAKTGQIKKKKKNGETAVFLFSKVYINIKFHGYQFKIKKCCGHWPDYRKDNVKTVYPPKHSLWRGEGVIICAIKTLYPFVMKLLSVGRVIFRIRKFGVT